MKKLNRLFTLIILVLLSFNHLSGQNSSVLFKDGKKQFELGNMEAAKKQFENCIIAFEGSSKFATKIHVDQSFMYLGVIEFHLLNFEQSRKYMEKLVDRNSHSGYVFLKKYYEALEYYTNMDYQKCIKLVNNILLYDVLFVKDDITAFAYSLSASCNEKMGNDTEAFENYATIIAKYKKVPSKGIALSKLGKKEEAIKLMESIIQDDSSIDNYYTLACIYLINNNNKEKALECLNQSLQLGLTSPYYLFIRDDINEIRKSIDFQDLINKYNIKESRNVKDFFQKLETEDYNLAVKIGSLESFNEFLKKYPESIWEKEVINYISEISEWEKLDLNSILDIKEFQSKYPNGLHRNDIHNITIDNTWTRIVNDSNIVEVENFIKNYPSHHKIDEAKIFFYTLFWGDKNVMTDPYTNELKQILGVSSLTDTKFAENISSLILDRETARRIIIQSNAMSFPKLSARYDKLGAFVIGLQMPYNRTTFEEPLVENGFIFKSFYYMGLNYYMLSSRLKPFLTGGNKSYCEFEIAKLKEVQITGISGDEYRKEVEFVVVYEPNEVGRFFIPDSELTKKKSRTFKKYDDGWRIVE